MSSDTGKMTPARPFCPGGVQVQLGRASSEAHVLGGGTGCFTTGSGETRPQCTSAFVDTEYQRGRPVDPAGKGRPPHVIDWQLGLRVIKWPAKITQQRRGQDSN